MTLHAAIGKYVIAIDEDIDPGNADAVLWACRTGVIPPRTPKW